MVVTASAVVIQALGQAWPPTGSPGAAVSLVVMAIGVMQIGMGFGLLTTALRLRRELTG